MISAKRIYWIAQLTGWAAYCLLVTFNILTSDPKLVDVIFLVNVASIFVFGILTTHFQRFLIIRLNWLELRLPSLIPRLMFTSFLSALILGFTTNTIWFITNFSKTGNYISLTQFIVEVFALLILVLFWNAIYFTVHFFQKSRYQEFHNLELAASNKESELKNLRSQLNPHFLFNSLNSIRALVDLDPAKAKVGITTLSNLLRQSLVLGRENLVSLDRELEMVKNYLDLEKIRFEERLMIDWQVDENLKEFRVIPFSVQMLVENAIKHGISNLKEGGIVRIIAKESGTRVELIVENSGNLGTDTDLGVGIQNIRQRLQLQYGDSARFMLAEKNGMVESKIIFEK